jgi:glycosyltransferase involved in cell wall biosynthesis
MSQFILRDFELQTVDRTTSTHRRDPIESAGIPSALIVADNCSLRFGGEASLPYHYFRLLWERGAEVHLVTHERCKRELEIAFPGARDHLHFIRDNLLHKAMYSLGRRLPHRLDRASFGLLARIELGVRQRWLIRRLVREKGIRIVHQPSPVSPAEPSAIYGVAVPVVIGPMNGGMDFPRGFRERESRIARTAVQVGRRLRHLINWLIPGKQHARILMVANPRTRQVLPRGLRGEVLELVENGVDLSTWQAPKRRSEPREGLVRFVYLGRLVDWKGVDLLLEAWSAIHGLISAKLQIIGDGPMRGQLEALSKRLGLTDSVQFTGMLTQSECAERLADADALILPSLMECGGSAVLEAMAMGLPVIATRWGGPADYLDDTCGLLISPESHASFVAALAAAIRQLHGSRELRQQLGRAARRKVIGKYSWDAKIDRIIEIYRSAVVPSGEHGSWDEQPEPTSN